MITHPYYFVLSLISLAQVPLWLHDARTMRPRGPVCGWIILNLIGFYYFLYLAMGTP